jgi:large subunit ribosomal protein L24
MAARIRKGDNVIVLVGKDKGKRGEIKEVLTKSGKVIVEGINILISHQKQSKDNAGGRISKSAPINTSNVALIDPKSDKATKIKFELRDGKKVRVSKKSGELIDE